MSYGTRNTNNTTKRTLNMKKTANAKPQLAIAEALDEIYGAVKNSRQASVTVISRYTAAIAVNFTDWMGKTLPWARHPYAQFVLKDNLCCEATEDHVGMLHKFAHDCGALPRYQHHQWTHVEVTHIRRLLADPVSAGLAGVALCAILETASESFIPDLAERAAECGCRDLTYTNTHGAADIEHSRAFLKALELESRMGYQDPQFTIRCAADFAADLFEKIYK